MQTDALSGFDSAVKAISKSSRVALIHDLDADGISSGAITYNALRVLRGKKPELLITQTHKTTQILPQSMKKIRSKKIDVAIIVDFALDQSPQSLKELGQVCKTVLVIDHHKDYGYPQNERTFIIKPQHFSQIEPSKYPTSKLVFDLFSRHVDLSAYCWIASIGLMGDNQLGQWRDFVGESAKASASSVEQLSKCVDIITAIETLAPKKLNELLLFIASSTGPQKILASKYAGYLKTMDKKLDSLFEKFKKEKEILEKQGLVWFEYKSKDNIKSALINKISNELYPGLTVICVQDSGKNTVSFSARRQDFKVKANELLENAVRGFENAGAGGHVPAAAGKIMKKDLSEFKARVIELLG